MKGSSSNQFVEIIDQGTQQIMPVPIPESGISNVPSPNSTNPLRAVYKPLEHNRKNDNQQYCNFLSAAPRDPLVNVPYLGAGCPYDANARNQPEGCYVVKNTVPNGYSSTTEGSKMKYQGTVGYVCNDAGGTKNANQVRGNQFGVDYDMDVDGLSKSKKAEYTIENPVQLPIQMRNPIVKYDKSTFYPTYLQSYNSLGTYPHASNYDNENIAKGLPTYVYPYKVLNQHKSEKDVISLRNGDRFVNQNNGNGVIERNGEIIEYAKNIEYFSGINSSNVDERFAFVSKRNQTVSIIFTILGLILILMLIFCKKIEIGCLVKKFFKK
jgi:hypothetical protein